MGFLRHLQAAEGQAWQLNWQRTCTSILTGTNDVELEISEMSALHLAAFDGHCDVLRFYIDRDLLTDLDAISVELLTPVHAAAFNGEVDAVKFLYSRGASLNLKSADGSLPLHLAVRNQHAEVVKFLVENGGAMDTDIRGLSPVGYALQLQNQSIIDCLRTSKQYFDYQSKPGRRDEDFVYAYEQALNRGDVDDCKLLCGQGCPVNADLPGQEGRSALIMAIESSNVELIKWLLANNAKATEQTLTQDGKVVSPLSAMIMRPPLNDVLPLLLQRYRTEGGLAVNERPSLICIAAQHDNTMGLDMLLDHLTGDEMTTSLDGETPLHFAAREGNREAVEMLLDYGADVNAFDDDGMTPLHRAIESEPLKESPAAKLLLSHGAALEPRDEWGSTAVMLASKRGDTELVRLLAEAGADLKAPNFSSWTCLHFAAEYGHLETFVWLVSRGLQLHAKNSNGSSAVQHASVRSAFSSFLLNSGYVLDHIDAITCTIPGNTMNWGPAWLKEHFNIYLRRLGLGRLRQTLAVTNLLRLGADVDFEGSPSGSALMAACSSGRLESVKILVRHGAAISYLGEHGIRSAVDAARNHKVILAWLLVDRFTEQRKLSDPAEAESTAHSAEDLKPWSGVVKKELIITGTAERQVHESARSYWFRLMVVKNDWRGRVVNQNRLAQTHRPSRLVPEEPFTMHSEPPQPPPFIDHTPGSLIATADRLTATLSEAWNHVSLIPVTEATFENAIQPLINEENQRLTESRILYFLSSASTSKEVRVAAKDASTNVTQATIQQLTREDVFRVVSAVSQRPETQRLPPESQLYLKKLMHEFKMNGLGVEDPEARERLKRDNLRLVEVLKEYIMNLNADVSGIWLSLDELEGLPPNAIERIKETEKDGKFWVNFKTPNRVAMLNNAKNASVRRRYYTAWDNRMEDANGPLLTEMLQLRHDTAKTLGFENFAVSRDAERMLSAVEASSFLSGISEQLLELGRQELDQLVSLKESELVNLQEDLQDESLTKAIFRWDFAYYKRMAKDGGSKLGGDKVSEYFSFQLVLPKLFQVFSLLFGLRFVILSDTDKSIKTWHPDVMAIGVWDDVDKTGEFLGYLFIDPYPREGKYGHVGQYATKPSLLNYTEVVSCFHEMGHSIHYLTSRSIHARFHQNTPRDFLEIPSRMLEHFFYDKNVIRAVSCHYENPEEDNKLPEDAIEKLVATRYENVASTKLGDLVFAKFDLAVHTAWDDPATRNLSVLLNKLRHDFSLLSGPEDLGLGYGTLHGQTHVRFIHGYGASYYSYLL
ncbi:hypothetical protein SLS64_012331 [Diaporthe eres]